MHFLIRSAVDQPVDRTAEIEDTLETNDIMNVLHQVKRVYGSLPKTLRQGLPFVSFMLGGSYVLSEFAKLRYQFRKTQMLEPSELEKHGEYDARRVNEQLNRNRSLLFKIRNTPAGIHAKPASETTIEKVYEEIKDMDVDNWENIRGPRPEEPGSEEIIAKMKAQATARREQTERDAMERIRSTN